MSDNVKIAVIGLGYVGLPITMALARVFPRVVGYDCNQSRIDELAKGIDRTGEVDAEALANPSLLLSSDPESLKECNFFIVTVPTPVDSANRPDLSFVESACETVGQRMPAGSIIVFETTVYPGVTEDVCGPLLAKVSGLRQGVDFKLGYSPERINPGDRTHRLDNIVKVVSAEDEQTLQTVAGVYSKIVNAGVHLASSIKVAEAAKVIENTQRDINIAFMNELSIVFDRLGIRTKDVLEAASTKWNFLGFSPGLVGGHCIGVDPYYLTYKAEELGYIPQVILSGRRINEGMGKFIAEKTMKLLRGVNRSLSDFRIGIFGLTFKENVPDIRNSKVPGIINEFLEYGITPLVHDPLANAAEVRHEYGISLTDWNDMVDFDAVIVAVPHNVYLNAGAMEFVTRLRQNNGVLVDVKSIFAPDKLPKELRYWSL